MPIDASQVKWDEPQKIDAAQVVWDTPAVSAAAPAPEENGKLGPWASAAIRPLAQGIAALPLLAMDAGVGTRNFIMGENYDLPSKMFNESLDALTTKPEGVGKGAEFVSSALAGGGLGGAPAAARQAPAGFTSAMKKAVTPVEEFLERGIPLTTGRRGGGVARAAEDFLANVPGVGGLVKARQQEALEAWNTSLLRQIDSKIVKGGKEGFEQAGQTLSNAYKSIWKAELPFNRAGLRDAWTSLSTQIGQRLPKEAADDVVGTLRHQFSQILSGARQGGTQGATLETVDDALREAAKKAAKAGEGTVAGFYNQARTAFREQMDPIANQALKRTDELYMRLSTLRNAAKRSGWETFTPAQLLMAAKRKASDKAVAEMTAPFQEEALKAADVLGTARSGAQAALERGVGKTLGNTLGLMALGGGAALDLGTTATAAGLGRLAYTKAGQKLLTEGIGKVPAGRALNATLAQLEAQNAP